MISRSHLFVALFGLLLIGCEQSPEDRSISTICDIIEQQDRYIGTIVRLKAVYHTTYEHGAILVDPNCPNSPIDDLTPDKSDNQSVKEFYKTITPDVFGSTKPAYYLVDLTGRIVSAKDLPVPLGANPNHVPLGIELKRIWAFKNR